MTLKYLRPKGLIALRKQHQILMLILKSAVHLTTSIMLMSGLRKRNIKIQLIRIPLLLMMNITNIVI